MPTWQHGLAPGVVWSGGRLQTDPPVWGPVWSSLEQLLGSCSRPPSRHPSQTPVWSSSWEAVPDTPPDPPPRPQSGGCLELTFTTFQETMPRDALEHEKYEKVRGRKEAVKCGRKLAGIGRFACRFRDPLPENQYNGSLECRFGTD